MQLHKLCGKLVLFLSLLSFPDATCAIWCAFVRRCWSTAARCLQTVSMPISCTDLVSSLLYSRLQPKGRRGAFVVVKQQLEWKCFLQSQWTEENHCWSSAFGGGKFASYSHLAPPSLGTEAGSRQGKQADNQVEPEQKERKSGWAGRRSRSMRQASERREGSSRKSRWI